MLIFLPQDVVQPRPRFEVVNAVLPGFARPRETLANV